MCSLAFRYDAARWNCALTTAIVFSPFRFPIYPFTSSRPSFFTLAINLFFLSVAVAIFLDCLPNQPVFLFFFRFLCKHFFVFLKFKLALFPDSMAAIFPVFLLLLLFWSNSVSSSSSEVFSGESSSFEICDVNGSFPVTFVSEISVSEGAENKILKIVRLEVLGSPTYLDLPIFFSVSRVTLVLRKPKKNPFGGGLFANHPHVEACHHRNATMPFGKCSGPWWTFDKNGELTFSTSPFKSYYVDLKLPSSGLNGGKVDVHAQEEFQKARVFFLVLGFLIYSSAPFLSRQVVLYYSVFMMLGTIIILFITFRKAMSVLPTGRTGTWYVIVFGSLVGAGSLMWSVLLEKFGELFRYFGLNGDVGFAMTLLFLVILIGVGAALGVWFLRKFVLTQEGTIDLLTIRFVMWFFRFAAIVMLSQSSIEPFCIISILVSVVVISFFLSMMPQMFSKLFLLRKRGGNSVRRRPLQRSAPVQGGHGVHALARLPPCPSTIHRLPHRDRKDIDDVAYACTQGALNGLYRSPRFRQWAYENFRWEPPQRRQERTFEEIQATAYMPMVDDNEEELDEVGDDTEDD